MAVDLWLGAVTPEQTRLEVDFLIDALRLPAGGSVLDVPCGGGRHGHELAERGFHMTGVDISPEFLDAARATALDRNLEIDWQQREMRDLPWTGQFDGAFCFGNSFGYLDDDGNADFLQAVAGAVKPGGRFALDTAMVAESLLPQFQPRRWFEVGDILFLVDNRYDPETGRVATEYTFVRNGITEKRSGSHRVYTYRELWALLHTAGFTDLRAFASPDSDPYALGSQRLLLTATRKLEG